MRSSIARVQLKGNSTSTTTTIIETLTLNSAKHIHSHHPSWQALQTQRALHHLHNQAPSRHHHIPRHSLHSSCKYQHRNSPRQLITQIKKGMPTQNHPLKSLFLCSSETQRQAANRGNRGVNFLVKEIGGGGSSARWRVANKVQVRMREVEGCGATWVAFVAGETISLAGLLLQLTPMAMRACIGSVESGATRNGSL